jgi:hypothetical protein
MDSPRPVAAVPGSCDIGVIVIFDGGTYATCSLLVPRFGAGRARETAAR